MIRCFAMVWVLGLAAAAEAQFVWTGGGGDGRFSNPTNWANGNAPAPGDNGDRSTLSISSPYSRSVFNDLPGLRVGTLTFGTVNRASDDSLPITVARRLEPTWSAYRLALPVRLEGTLSVGIAYGGFPGLDFAALSGGGHIDLASSPNTYPQASLFLSNPDLTGQIRAGEGSYLGIYGGDSRIGGIQSSGIVDLAGRITPAGGSLDLRGATLDLLGIPFSPEIDARSGVVVDGDLKLGRWHTGGYEYYTEPYAVDFVEVTGTLDLREASIGTAGGLFESAGGWPLPLLSRPGDTDPSALPAYITIARYGNRLGQFAEETLPVIVPIDYFNVPPELLPELLFEGEAMIVYTSSVNAGPGEVRIVLPEPAGGLMLVGLVALLGRRRAAAGRPGGMFARRTGPQG